MEILNVVENSASTFDIVLCIVLFVIAVMALIVAIATEESMLFIISILLLFLTFIAYDSTEYYRRYEVTIHEGYVIDAQKYEIVEQRGDIYVLEERK